MCKICQSCGMPLKEDKHFSTNSDRSLNTSYCSYCYEDGEFIDKCNNLNEKIEQSVVIAIQSGMTKQKAEDLANSILPYLNRWKN